jgi:hypothetical protein
MSMLLGEIDLRDQPAPGSDAPQRSKIVLDLQALEANDDAAPVLRYARSIVLDRGDWNGRVLSIRKDDVRALASVLHLDEGELIGHLDRWGALVESSGPLSPLPENVGS